MMTMITVTPFPSEKIPVPAPVMIGTAWIQMIETADFMPEKPVVAVPVPPTDGVDKPVELHHSDAPAVAPPAPAPIVRTRITMHNGAVLWVTDTMPAIKAMMG